MKFLKANLFKILGISILFSGSVAIAAETVLRLDVSGTIGAGIQPEWRDKNGSLITSASLSFDGQIAGASSEDRDSQAFEVQLVNLKTNTDVDFQLPTACKIGDSSVSDTHVVLLVDDSAATGPIPFQEGVLKSLKLRFSGDGLYGDKSGAVTCTSGKLTYMW